MSPLPRGFARFLLLWVAQTVSTMGTQLTGFGLGVWVYQRTQSTALYALVALASFAPQILVAPLLGGQVDRKDLRQVMIVGHGGAGVCSLSIALLFAMDALPVGAIIGLVAVGAAFNSIHLPAFPKATTLLVDPPQLPRANGLMQLGMALGYIVSPLLAAMLMPTIGLVGILTIDVTTFLFAITVISNMRISTGRASEPPPASESKRYLWQDAVFGWRYITCRPGLLGLQAIITAMSFNLGIIQVLVTPLVLSFADVRVLGIVMFMGGLGMLVGSVVLMAWGGPRRRIQGVLAFVLLQGVFLLVGSLRSSAVLVGAGAFGVLFTIPFIMACNQTLWQRKVPAEVQGRVFAVHAAISGASIPVAYLLAGPLTDLIFEPLMVAGGPLAGSVGQLLGVGRGRGIALLFALLGVASFLFVLFGALTPAVRHLEKDLPDVPPRESTSELPPFHSESLSERSP